MRWAVHKAHMGNVRNSYIILIGKPAGKRQLGRPRHRWEDNVKNYLKEIGWEGVDCTELAQDGDQWLVLVSTVMNLQVPQKMGIM
jgi:hypothetical protein